MKKACYSILTATLVAALASCSGNTDKGTPAADSTKAPAADTTVTSSAPATPAPAAAAPVDSMSSSMKDTTHSVKAPAGNAAKPTPTAKPAGEIKVGNAMKPKGN